jgi:hypothetical protein
MLARNTDEGLSQGVFTSLPGNDAIFVPQRGTFADRKCGVLVE